MEKEGFMAIIKNFVSIEGVDGTGKGTQAEITHDYLANDLGKKVLKISFPQYGQTSAAYVEKYLNGDFGLADEVPADLGALPFMIDRFAAKLIIENQTLLPNSFTITDRYVASNLAHQGTKIQDKKARHKFYKRTMHTEYEILSIPKPSLNIVLLLPTNIAQANVDKKGSRIYTTKIRDIHEADSSHLDRARINYVELCQLYPEEFTPIQCLGEDGVMRSVDDIQNEIRNILFQKKLLD